MSKNQEVICISNDESKMEIDSLQLLLSQMLCGAQLEALHIHSLTLEIEFNQIGKPNLPLIIYLNTNNPIFKINDLDQNYEKDFFEQRKIIISELYSLIGNEINSVQVSKKGELTINISEKTFLLCRSPEEFEKIWIIKNQKDYDLNSEPIWYISWSDYDEIYVNVPEPRKN
ncbi:hypothetical protein [Leptospira santarosai]|uniref:hypothetical protein n=1 Tax=Leptospira santarosai TaxID=28183 RepID=UPI00037E7472|nr:hypothetical protein [Leptospira santarosai]MDI7230474.1 hypothetical protein [Leptospira santarosai]MDI7237871.1 hypothetical protein [Leptospira santarosai]